MKKSHENELLRQNIAKNQHYVRAKYLQAWEVNGPLYSYNRIAKKLRPLRAGNVARERFTYHTPQLTQEDHYFLDQLIEMFPAKELRSLAKGWVKTFQLSYELRLFVDENVTDPILRHKLLEYLCQTEKTLGEDYHQRIEQKAIPLIASLQTGDSAFMENVEARNDFYFFISNQYFRTRKMRKSLINIRPVRGHDPNRTALIESVIFATNVAAGLIADRFRIHFVENETDTPFITSDQPVINLSARLNQSPPTELKLYYPISPRLALRIELAGERLTRDCARHLEVHGYNFMIANAAENEMFSNDEGCLAEVVATLEQHL